MLNIVFGRDKGKTGGAKRMRVITFHDPNEENGYLSNWYLSDFEVRGVRRMATGDALLAEAAVRDHIWGIGLSMRDPKRLNQRLWNGQNLLGYATMLVRDRI